MGVFLGGSLFDNVVKMSVMERMNYGGIFGGISETVKMQVIEYALISPSIRFLLYSKRKKGGKGYENHRPG
jgi:hypothetical protein